MLIIDDLLLAPFKGVLWISKKINDVAQREFSDEGRIKEKLMELQLRFEMDEVSEAEYNKQEKELLDRLETIRKAKKEA